MGSTNGPGRKVIDNGSTNKPKRAEDKKPVDNSKGGSSARGSTNGPSRG